MGVPVISSKVGAVEEFTTLTYETFDDLVNLIKGLIIPKNSWEIQAKEMMEVFNRLVEEKGNKI